MTVSDSLGSTLAAPINQAVSGCRRLSAPCSVGTVNARQMLRLSCRYLGHLRYQQHVHLGTGFSKEQMGYPQMDLPRAHCSRLYRILLQEEHIPREQEVPGTANSRHNGNFSPVLARWALSPSSSRLAVARQSSAAMLRHPSALLPGRRYALCLIGTTEHYTFHIVRTVPILLPRCFGPISHYRVALRGPSLTETQSRE